ncbi:hypothetical protein KQI68_07295 [Peptoniphilus sp. MSJ-1]|uniref:Phage protein n=1 Tax=Peptoniphilus ovalis TaxID=2841503 RepID=A0ABS6FHL0_9FIRM|nr:hypothetical protein [Peptoniphilus ovalis]MBU5669644.1 hypothetical protein [Peptoniphilus ovalis]
MKVYYDNELSFDLPATYDLEERLTLINCLLEDYADKFELSHEANNVHDNKIYRVLDKFGYYLCTYKTHHPDGKALYKDSEIIRKGRESIIKQKELPLFNFYK